MLYHLLLSYIQYENNRERNDKGQSEKYIKYELSLLIAIHFLNIKKFHTRQQNQFSLQHLLHHGSLQ